MKLDNAINLLSHYCPRSRLPLLPIAHEKVARSFWSDAFAYSDGTAKKFKARFCVRGGRQKEGAKFFETYSPVAQWTTIRSAMVLAAKLGLVSAQCDITAAFLHAVLPPTKNI